MKFKNCMKISKLFSKNRIHSYLFWGKLFKLKINHLIYGVLLSIKITFFYIKLNQFQD